MALLLRKCYALLELVCSILYGCDGHDCGCVWGGLRGGGGGSCGRKNNLGGWLTWSLLEFRGAFLILSVVVAGAQSIVGMMVSQSMKWR